MQKLDACGSYFMYILQSLNVTNQCSKTVPEASHIPKDQYDANNYSHLSVIDANKYSLFTCSQIDANMPVIIVCVVKT